MATVTELRLLTAEEFAELSFEVPVELVRGEIVEMPRPDVMHGTVCVNVTFPLTSWNRSVDFGLVVSNDSGVVTERDPDTVRGPDAMVISKDRLPDGIAPRGFSDLVPNLAIEVLSPSERWKKVLEKVSEYLNRGVDEVWVVDPRRHTVQVFRPDDEPTCYGEQDEITSSVLPGFSCRVSEFFLGI
ncbi:MAG TPA: Uma2 family endonuclease [Planctomycetaceae bacterium]|nr:Uma2 family endonuclease [Planctomycetaceae bacterium]